jgi:hypothetical protein
MRWFTARSNFDAVSSVVLVIILGLSVIRSIANVSTTSFSSGTDSVDNDNPVSADAIIADGGKPSGMLVDAFSLGGGGVLLDVLLKNLLVGALNKELDTLNKELDALLNKELLVI